MKSRKIIHAFAALGSVLCILFPLQTHALVIRGYDDERHDRFESGFPAAPVVNTNFYQIEHDFSGVGWMEAEPFRYVALISRSQFVTVRHFRPLVGTTINFRARDGAVRGYTIADYLFTTNDAGLPSDLAIGELSTPIDPCDDITWYSIADLGAETNYLGVSFLVYGWHNKVGIGTIGSMTNFVDLVGDPEEDINETRVTCFYYPSSTGGVDDCRIANGDSGSPSFLVQDGELNVLAVHTALNTVTNGFFSRDTFIPAYADQIAMILDTNVVMTTDTDGDCLDDAWETNWFGSLQYGPDDDVDRDGLTNRLERDRGSDPTTRLAPMWWGTRAVINTNLMPNDFAAENLGQLKWLATSAAVEMESVLASGAGNTVLNVVTNFSATSNYNALNQGQLKSIAALFYDRLKQLGQTDVYPWGPAPSSNDWAVVNIGQLKHLFSFDISAP